MTRLQRAEVAEQLPGWTVLASAVHNRFATKGFAKGVAFLERVGEVADAANHHPDVVLTWPAVEIRLVTHDEGGITEKDVSMAREIDAIAAELGITSDPHAVQEVELGLDTADAAAIAPFWWAVLGRPQDVGENAEEDIVEGSPFAPGLWFQETGPHETPRQRWHPDIWVSVEERRRRVAAATAAGGTVVDDHHGESFVVLADADGNRVCLCTSADR